MNRRLLGLVACLMLKAGAIWAGDEFDGAWHDSGGYDGNWSQNAHVESSTHSRQGSDGSQINESKASVRDDLGNRMENNIRETQHKDGTVSSKQDTTYTDQFGRKVNESTTRRYDANGNLIEEKRSSNSGDGHAQADGIEVEMVHDQPGGVHDTITRTYGDEFVKIENQHGTDVIHNLSTEQSHVINRSLGTYTPSWIYYCLDLNAAMMQKYGSVGNYMNQTANVELMQQLQEMPNLPGVTPQMRDQLMLASQNMENARQQAQTYIPPDPQKFVYEFTKQKKIISGFLAEQVLISQDGKPIHEIWLSDTIHLRGVMNNSKLKQKAADHFFSPSKEHSTPQIRRLFGRMVVYSKSTSSFGESVTRVTKARRKKLKPDEFVVPQGLKIQERPDPQAAIV